MWALQIKKRYRRDASYGWISMVHTETLRTEPVVGVVVVVVLRSKALRWALCRRRSSRTVEIGML
jgi:hypothetical protein